MTICGYEHSDAAYVLGALNPTDRADFERHLAGCADCARSVRELAGLPGLLARVPLARVEAQREAPPLPDTLLPRLVRRVRRSRRRHRWAVAAVVAVAVAITGVSAGTVLNHDDQPAAQVSSAPVAKPRQFTPVAGASISGWVSLTPVPWGTRLDLTCSYTARNSSYADRAQAQTYTMVITRHDGTTEQVGSWQAESGRTMHLQAATATKASDIARVVVRTAASKDVLELSLA